MNPLKTYVYIDGFNFYYGCIKKTKFHWLDLNKFCKFLLPKYEILKIKYYTAQVTPRPPDLREPLRQQTYLRALKTIPHLEIIMGHYLSHEVSMPLSQTESGKNRYVKVIKTEEKGSDVNLACHLLHDAHLGNYDVAVVVSNDSDLAEPIRIVTQELGKSIGIVNPHRHPSQKLLKLASFYRTIRPKILEKSQFPFQLEDQNGIFHIPDEWRRKLGVD